MRILIQNPCPWWGLVRCVGSRVGRCISKPLSSAVCQFSVPSVPALRGDEALNRTVRFLFCFRTALSNLEQGLLYNWLEFCPLPTHHPHDIRILGVGPRHQLSKFPAQVTMGSQGQEPLPQSLAELVSLVK